VDDRDRENRAIKMKTDQVQGVMCRDSTADGDLGWTTIIQPRQPWFHINFSELIRHRDLASLFIRRDFVTQYKQTILGPVWFLLGPLFTTVVMTVVFGKIAKIPTDGLPDFLFYLSGTVCWGYFATCLTTTSDTFVANAGIFGKVYFPRLIVPVSVVISSLIKFSIQLALLGGFIIFYRLKGASVTPSLWFFVLPLLIVQMALLGLGFGILISSLTVKYRDLNVVAGFGMTLWMYLTPVVYPLSEVPAQFQVFQMFNPMVPVVETFRLALLGKGTVTASHLILGWICTLIPLMVGLALFNRAEKTFLDTV
jgi:lipopolysaccharide transport system permease protein